MVAQRQLLLQTFSLIASFMVWVLISALLPYITADIRLTPVQATWTTAIPVILGSLLRVPAGYLANRFGARLLFIVSFFVLLLPVFYLSVSHSFTDLMISGFFLGIGGATFSVGVTSLPKYFAKEKIGTINGIYGVGNLGTAITTFAAPLLAGRFGWATTVRCYLLLLLAFIALLLLFGDRREAKVRKPLLAQVKLVYRSERLWFLSLFYFITFGSFVAFTVYLPNFLVHQFALAKVDAGMRTAGFIVLATLIRPLGGFLSDRWNTYAVLGFVFAGLTASGVLLSFSLGMPLFTMGCLSVAACAGVGNGAVFKLVPLYFAGQSGIVNGIVAAAGGLGGFFPPLLLTLLYGITGHYAIGFMALSEAALASLVLVFWLSFRDRLQLASDIVESTADAIMVTDPSGRIETVNHAFTEVTGYARQEVIGRNPNLLSSGRHDAAFYDAFWERIAVAGHWQGETYNRRKDGGIYREWLTVSAIKDEGGEVRHYVAIFSDMGNCDHTEK